VFQYNNVLNSSKENSLRRLRHAIVSTTVRTGTLISTVDIQILVKRLEEPPNNARISIVFEFLEFEALGAFKQALLQFCG
jgi:hypothetical protein